MNLATFRSRVSHATGLSNTSGSTEQGLIDGWVNEAVEQFLRKTKIHVRTASLALTADQGDYELDTDILSFRNVWIEPANDGPQRTLDQVSELQIIEYRRLATATPDPTARWFALGGANVFMLYPAPDDSGDMLHIAYVPRPAALAATADSPSSTANGGIPSEFHPTLEAYAKWKAGEHAANPLAPEWRQEWFTGIADAKIDTGRKAGLLVTRARIGYRTHWPVSPGVDTGV